MTFVSRRAALVAALAAFSTIGCTARNYVGELEKQNQVQSKAIDDLRRQNEQLQRENTGLKKQLELAGVHMDTLAKQANVAEKLQAVDRDLQDWIARQPQEGPIVQTARDEFTIEGDFLFRPGQEDVAKEARATLREFAEKLRDSGTFLKIIGHTDNDPIRASARENPTLMNLELGARRATFVAHEFKKAGIDELQIQTASMGEACPVADNGTGDGRKKNRRVVVMKSVTPPAGHHPQPRRGADAEKKPAKKEAAKEEPTK